MKKLMMIAAMMLMSIGAFAQAGKTAVGVNLGYAGYGNGYNPLGVGAKVQYEFVESVRAEVAYNFWGPKDELGVMDFNLNLQYLIPVDQGLNVYPLVGANLAMTYGDSMKEVFGGQESIFGFQGGVGIEYYVSDNFKLNADVKYQYNKKTKSVDIMGTSLDMDLKYDGPVIQIGAAYVF